MFFFMNNSTQEIKTPIEAIREMVLSSFENFIKYFQVEYYGYKPNLYDYQLQIVDSLEDVIRGKTTRLIINVPPRYRKTQISVKDFIAYGLALSGGKAKYIHVSYAQKLALDNSEAIRDFISSEPFQKLFPEVQIKKDSNAKEKWYTTAGGGVYATSSGGQVTGFGAGASPEDYDEDGEEFETVYDEFFQGLDPLKFGGALVIDDPNKADDGDSPVALAKVNNRFDTTISNRVNSRYTPIINIQQRVHKNDLSGKLIKDGDWTLLRLSAINPETGKALCEAIHTLPELEKIRDTNSVVFDSQYQQNPKEAEGLMYPIINKVNADREILESAELLFTSTDANMTDGNDFFVTWFWAVWNGRPFIYDVIYEQIASKNIKGLYVQKHLENKSQIAIIELNNQQTFIGEVEHLMNCKVVPITARTNKLSRMISKAHLAEKVGFISWNGESPGDRYIKAITHMAEFNKNGSSEDGHDDAEDAFTLGLQYLWTNYQHLFI